VAVAALRCLIAAGLAAAIIVCAGASPAQAYVIDGVRWPGTTITYYPTAYRTAVDRAARNWDHANVGVRFRRASSASAADVIVKLGAQQCGGFSIVGWPRWWSQSWVKLSSGCDRDLVTLVATHEFGHTLGLGHEIQRCARMNPVVDYRGTPEFCQYHPISYWLAHPLKGDDSRGARTLYSSPVRVRAASRPRAIG